MNEIIEVKDLSVAYDELPVLKHISVSFRKNKITAVIGHSGSGKSTLLSAINGLIQFDEHAKTTGEILLDGENTKNISGEALRKRIGTVFQSPTPFPFSIRKNMEYAPVFYGIKDKQRLNQILVENLKIVGLYEEVKDDLNKNAQKLSGGQQQRLCIARALTAKPEVLLLDEPCSALDFSNTRLIEDLLLQLKKQYTIVIVTHDLFEAKRIADDCVFISDHELIESGDFQEMIEHPKETRTAEYLQDLLK